MSTTDTSSDWQHDQWVKNVRTDRDAFAALYNFYYPRILGYCSRRLASHAVGEDLTSDVFLAAATKIDSFRGNSAGEFSQWLYTIATNRIHEYLRSFERRRSLLEAAAMSQQVRSSETHDNLDHLDMAAIYEALLTMKPRDQALISLRFMQDLPYEQIAAILNIKPGTVRVALGRALQKLRDQFGGDQSTSTKGAPA